MFTGQQGVVSSNQGLEPSEYYPGNISYDPEGCIISTTEPEMTVKFPAFVDYTFKLDFDGMKTVSLTSMGDAAASVRYSIPKRLAAVCASAAANRPRQLCR